METPTTLRIDDHSSYVVITLNRPERLNALSPLLLRELRQALEEVAQDRAVRALLLTGEGRGFSSGADLRDAEGEVGRSGTVDVANHLLHGYHPVITLLRTMPKPVVCAINGVAAGAGCSLALAGDLVLAARSATFIQAFTRIGLIPDAGSTYLLPRLIGRQRALGMVLLAEPVSAEQAESWGLIWRAVDDDRLHSEALALVQRLADGPTVAFGLAKAALEASFGATLDEQLALEAMLQGTAAQTADFRAGVAAFQQKRAAQFRGE